MPGESSPHESSYTVLVLVVDVSIRLEVRFHCVNIAFFSSSEERFSGWSEEPTSVDSADTAETEENEVEELVFTHRCGMKDEGARLPSRHYINIDHISIF